MKAVNAFRMPISEEHTAFCVKPNASNGLALLSRLTPKLNMIPKRNGLVFTPYQNLDKSRGSCSFSYERPVVAVPQQPGFLMLR